MSRVKLSILGGFQSASLILKKLAALQFFRHPPVRSVNLGIFSHLPFFQGGNLKSPFVKGRFRGILPTAPYATLTEPFPFNGRYGIFSSKMVKWVNRRTGFVTGGIMKERDDTKLISEKAKGYFDQGFN